MPACNSVNSTNIRKHYYTEKLGWPELNPPHQTGFNIHAREKNKVNNVEFDFSMGCIHVNFPILPRTREI